MSVFRAGREARQDQQRWVGVMAQASSIRGFHYYVSRTTHDVLIALSRAICKGAREMINLVS